MDQRIFFWNVMGRVTLLILTSFLFIWFVQSVTVELVFTLVAGILLLILQVFLLTKYVLNISNIVDQFIEAIGREEVPEIRFSTGKAAFKGLKERSNAIKQRLNKGRIEQESSNRILKYVVNAADLGMICFRREGDLFFMNEAAKIFVNDKEVNSMTEIRSINEKLWNVLNGLTPGISRVVRIGNPPSPGREPGKEFLFSISLKEIQLFQQTFRLFTLHNIQEELHRNESDSWQKIIRVLTHEIMNAVAPMLSMTKSMVAQLSGSSDIPGEKILKGLRVIESTGTGLIEFTEEYRQLALLPEPKKERFRLEEALQQTLFLMETEATEKKIHLSLDLEEKDAMLFADRQQFEMIVLNLLKNSFEALRMKREERKVHISVRKERKRMLVVLEDNGPGIPEPLIDQVFVPFFTTREEGSGIGLSLARQIMNKHDGSITLESVSGENTVVTLSFPR